MSHAPLLNPRAPPSLQPICEREIQSLQLKNGAEFDQTDRVKDLIAPGDTLVASYLQVGPFLTALLAEGELLR